MSGTSWSTEPADPVADMLSAIKTIKKEGARHPGQPPVYITIAQHRVASEPCPCGKPYTMAALPICETRRHAIMPSGSVVQLGPI